MHLSTDDNELTVRKIEVSLPCVLPTNVVKQFSNSNGHITPYSTSITHALPDEPTHLTSSIYWVETEALIVDSRASAVNLNSASA